MHLKNMVACMLCVCFLFISSARGANRFLYSAPAKHDKFSWNYNYRIAYPQVAAIGLTLNSELGSIPIQAQSSLGISGAKAGIGWGFTEDWGDVVDRSPSGHVNGIACYGAGVRATALQRWNSPSSKRSYLGIEISMTSYFLGFDIGFFKEANHGTSLISVGVGIGY